MPRAGFGTSDKWRYYPFIPANSPFLDSACILNDIKTKEFMRELDLYFGKKVKVPRIYLGKLQTFKALMNEEALLLPSS